MSFCLGGAGRNVWVEEAGISYEIVPGVSSALAVPAYGVFLSLIYGLPRLLWW